MTSKNFTVTVLTGLTTAILVVCNARADITTDLQGYWTLADGPGSSTVMDHSGNGNTGTLVNYTDDTYNNMWTTDSDPSNGWPYALTFNESGLGTNTYVNIPDSTSLDSGSVSKQWTIAAWVNCAEAGTAEPNNAGLVTKGVLNTEQYGLFISGGQFVGELHNSAGTGGFKEAATTTIAANTWYHVVMTALVPKNGTSEILMYVDGVLENPANNNTYTTVYTSSLPMTIGTRSTGPSPGTYNLPFSGTIDEVRFYNRALAASDVMQLYDNQAYGIVNSGVGWWNGSTGTGGNGTLDTVSANFCTNVYTNAVGTFYNLANLLAYENAQTQPISNSCVFGDDYYNSTTAIPVTTTNIAIATGGVALANANGPGTLYFANSKLLYTLSSSDTIGLMDGGGNKTALVMTGGGTTILTGVNTFTGGTTVKSGTLQIGNGGASGSPLGSGPVSVNGTLAFDGDDNPTFNNAISGGGSVVQEGTGTLTLGAINTYSGATTLASGSLSVSSMADGTSSLGTSAVNLNGGTLLYTGTGDTTVRQVNGGSGTTNTIDVPSGVTLYLNGTITGAAAFVINKVDTGTLSLGGFVANTNLGMNVNAGTLILNKSGGHAIAETLTINSGGVAQIGAGNNAEITNTVVVNSGGVFDLDGQGENFNNLSLAGNGSGSGALINSSSSSGGLTVPSITLASSATIGGTGVITIDGPISGTGPLTYAGAASLELENPNTYTGGTIVNSGLLDASTALTLPGNVTVNGGTLEMDDPSAMSPTATLTLPATPAAGSINLTFNGIEYIAALIIGGVAQPSGTYGSSSSGATYQSATFNGSGVLSVGGNYWDANGTDASAGNDTAGGGNGNWNSATSDWWSTGNADTTWGANGIAYFGGALPGTVTLNANETASGLVFTTAGYTINNLDGVSTLGLAGEYPTVFLPAGVTTISADISSGGIDYGLVATGPGTLVLSGTNTYGSGSQGGTLIENGATVSANTIADSGTSALSTGGVTINNGTLSYTSTSGQTARSVLVEGSAAGTINVPTGDSLEIDGQIHEVGDTAAQNSTFTGGGTLIMGGTADNTSLTMAITAGNVVITKTSASGVHGLGGGTSIVESGAGLQLAGSGGFDLYSGCILTVASGGVLDVNSQNDSFSTFTLSGIGPAGATYPGALINSTTTAVANITNGGSGVSLAGPTTIGGPGSITLASAVSGSGPITYVGSGTLTLGAAGTYTGGTVINSGTVELNNQSAAGTGNITDNTTLDVNIAAGTLTNTITGGSSSIVNIIETANDNLTLGGPMSGFTGTINCPASASTAKAQILSTVVNLPSTATINVAAGGTLYIANSVVIPCPVYMGGVGNSEVYGALRIESNAVVSGPVILQGNSTTGNNSAIIGTISGSISDGGHGYSLTKLANAGPFALAGTNTFTGPLTNLEGILAISGSGCLGVTATATNYAANIANSGTFDYASSAQQILSGVMSGTGELQQSGPGQLTLTDTNTFTGAISNGSTLVISGSGGLGVSATATNYAGLITNNGTFNYASSAPQILSGVIYGTGTLLQSGSGKLTLSNVDLYTGNTVIGSGATLALASVGSINDTASVNIGAGGTFDVSAYTLGYVLGTGSTSLSGGGTGTAVGTTAANIKANANTAPVTVGAVDLNYTPQSFTGDATHPALYVSPGSLDINGTGIIVTNAAASPLGAGTYSLIQATGSLTCATTNVTVVGTGLAPGAVASLAVASGSLNLVVSNTIVSVPTPAISSYAFSSGNLVLSGTNGLASGTYYVLTSTNLATPLSSWTVIATNTFGPTGNFSATNAVSTSPSYFIIEIPAP